LASVLVLNASHEPLSVVSDRRALVLVIRGKAILVEGRDEVWRSERHVARVPSVVRLTSFVHVPFQRTTPVTRRAVFGRDENRCQYCAGPAESIDHVLPRSRGGPHTWDHVVACCRRCNVRKGSRLPSEAGLTLARQPRAPMRHGWIYASAVHGIDPVWHTYLMLEATG
jgi:5-methylcytosine-specific restriction endonuclease McrA